MKLEGKREDLGVDGSPRRGASPKIAAGEEPSGGGLKVLKRRGVGAR